MATRWHSDDERPSSRRKEKGACGSIGTTDSEENYGSRILQNIPSSKKAEKQQTNLFLWGSILLIHTILTKCGARCWKVTISVTRRFYWSRLEAILSELWHASIFHLITDEAYVMQVFSNAIQWHQTGTLPQRGKKQKDWCQKIASYLDHIEERCLLRYVSQLIAAQ